MITKEQIEELTKNPEFAAAANACKTKEEAIALFGEYGIEIDSWDEFMKEFAALANTTASADGELDDDELANVQGGAKMWGVCLLGLGLGSGDGSKVGYKVGICFVVGVTL